MASKKTITNSYWADRFLLIEELSKRSADEVILELRREYTRTLHDLNRELLYWYERLSLNNGLTGGEAILQARKLLTADELKEFKWTVEEYVKHASDKELSVRFAKEVENASVRAHISRIDALKTQITMHTNYLAAVEVATLSKLMGDVYTDSFYRVAFEMQKMAGYFTPFATLDVYAVKQAIEKPWYADGLTFSDRIWKNQAALRLRLNSDLTQNIIRGQAPDKLITQITKEFGVTRYQAARLIYTERAAAMSRANYDCYRELGVEEYEILATLDNKTSELCQDMDGEHFRIEDYNIGTTAPPFHPNCRSTTMPYFGELKGGERIARDAEGNNYFVPGDMKYKEWKEKYVVDALPKEYHENYKKYASILGKDNLPSIDEYAKKWYNRERDIFKDARLSFRQELTGKNFESIAHLKGRLTNYEARLWYDAKVKDIGSFVDPSKTLRGQAQQAFDLRNTYKTQTRSLMEDKVAKAKIEKDDPIISFKTFMGRIMENKEFSRHEAYEYTIRSATRPNKGVNEILGIPNE